jgi:hypothetical protein
MIVLTLDGISLKGSIQRPEGRRGPLVHKPWAHNAPCPCEAHETFTCDRCGRRVGYCLGAHDNMPSACDFCWTPKGTP